MGQTPSSPPGASASFSEQEIPTRVRASMPWRDVDDSTRDDSTRDLEAAMGESLDSKTTAVPVDMLEAALAESRDSATSREEKSGARKRTVEREAFSVHEAETKRASTIQVRRALASAAEGAEVDQLLADVATVTTIPAQPEADESAEPAPKAKAKSGGRVLALVLLLLVLASAAGLLVVGKGSPRAGFLVVRGKLAAH